MSRTTRKQLITDTMAAMAAAGSPVRAARVCDNGDVLLLTEPPAGALPANDDQGGSWVDLAGQTEVPRAKGT